MERLDKFLCDSGVGTRSQVKAMLKAGRVAVDGKPEKDNGRKIDPKTQTITLDGEVLGGYRRVVLMLNKPEGFVTATEDKNDRNDHSGDGPQKDECFLHIDLGGHNHHR